MHLLSCLDESLAKPVRTGSQVFTGDWQEGARALFDRRPVSLPPDVAGSV